jgi:hypothetical protein
VEHCAGNGGKLDHWAVRPIELATDTVGVVAAGRRDEWRKGFNCALGFLEGQGQVGGQWLHAERCRFTETGLAASCSSVLCWCRPYRAVKTNNASAAIDAAGSAPAVCCCLPHLDSNFATHTGNATWPAMPAHVPPSAPPALLLSVVVKSRSIFLPSRVIFI